MMNFFKNLAPVYLKKCARYYVQYVKQKNQKDAVVNDGPQYFLPAGYKSRLQPIFEDHNKNSILWQPDVYSLASMLAQATHATHILDIGCGHGEKLVKFHPSYNVIGIDTKENCTWCSEHYNFGEWLSMDLEQSLPELPVDAIGKTVLICSDVIEHIIDAHGFLNKLYRLLGMCSIGVISTPDRGLLYPFEQKGPPLFKKHVREWTAKEFKQLLDRAGMEAWVGETRASEESWDMETIIAIVRHKNS